MKWVPKQLISARCNERSQLRDLLFRYSFQIFRKVCDSRIWLLFSSFVTASEGTWGCFQPSWPLVLSGDQASEGLAQPSSREVPVLNVEDIYDHIYHIYWNYDLCTFLKFFRDFKIVIHYIHTNMSYHIKIKLTQIWTNLNFTYLHI